MKEVITIQMVEQKTVKYIANDGKEFDDERSCRGHELDLRNKEIEDNFKRLPKIRFEIPQLDLYKCEGYMYKITFLDHRDVRDFIEYYTYHNYDLYYIKDTLNNIKSYPFTTCVDEGYDSVYFFNETQLLKDLKELINYLEGSEKTIPSNI